MLVALRATPFDIKDRRIKKIILDEIKGAKKIDYAVLLALDGVFRNGKYVESESHLAVPNDYIINIARRNKKVLFGASVNPYREVSSFRREMKKCIESGAVLFKWIPSSQQINPSDSRCLPFYKILTENDIPLLCHTGPEHAVPTSDSKADKYNDPARLKKALSTGVKVIAAHCATPYFGETLPDDKGYFEELIQMLRSAQEKKWNLYADISAFCTPTRTSHLKRINREIEMGNISPYRFLFGSDFPIPIVDINFFQNAMNLNELMTHIKSKANALDNNFDILKKFGIHKSIFTNAWDILNLPVNIKPPSFD